MALIPMKPKNRITFTERSETGMYTGREANFHKWYVPRTLNACVDRLLFGVRSRYPSSLARILLEIRPVE